MSKNIIFSPNKITEIKENNIPKDNKSNNNIDIDKILEDTLLNLKIISNIKENDKLNSLGKIVKINQPYMLQGLERWYNKESRNSTVEKLDSIVNNSFELTEIILAREKDENEDNKSLKENNNQIFQNLLYEMTNSLLGLENLKKTYKDDITISSKLDIIIKKMFNRIEKMNKLFSIKI